ncbi:MAG TPA: hypothetical protein VFV67_21750 [Actinophytocola sp.]|uniref:hypothetical protein n=1 Tax=Actinophytocola sp. TaxID=1872138 RepID=UPI002DBE2FDC|nr:hypothetical protein [Actinophytocola sp.]HEU5473278.1 hypothetical protein [Actinophytocola sp.]
MVGVQWWLSGYDSQVHAFPNEQAGTEYGEAICNHSVPNAKITCTDEGRRCMACMLLLGDLLAEQIDPTWRAS